MKKTKLMLGDNIQSLKKLPDNSIDSIVTDPPYALNFMQKRWDAEVPSVEFWKEVYRVLKPGGHILSFGGTRTYHRMVVNIEDAGFEIRDQVMWLYGSGFPKSHNIGKAVDKIQGNKREVVSIKENYLNIKGSGKSMYDDAWHGNQRIDLEETRGSSPYEGWGTALKPANEPICVARKPLSEKTIADNVIKWGTGGINIDGCRVGFRSEADKESAKPGSLNATGENSMFGLKSGNEQNEEGRFPANIILDETAAELLDEQSGVSKSTKAFMSVPDITGGSYVGYKGATDKKTERGHNDSGGASRFFYVAKVSKKERNLGLDSVEVAKNVRPQGEAFGNGSAITDVVKGKGNVHPTVKPVQLMSYLCRLITPENGIVLDPFMGSGSTGIAALLEGFRFVGMEMDEDYFKIAEARIENYEQYKEFIDKKKKK